MTPEEHPSRGFRWLLGERARAVLIIVPFVLMLASAEYNSWLFQERPPNPDPANAFVQVIDHKGIVIYATPGEAWTSQWLSNLGWLVVAICSAAFVFRQRLKPGSPIIRPPVDGVPYPAELIATIVVLASMAYGILIRKF